MKRIITFFLPNVKHHDETRFEVVFKTAGFWLGFSQGFHEVYETPTTRLT